MFYMLYVVNSTLSHRKTLYTKFYNDGIKNEKKKNK